MESNRNQNISSESSQRKVSRSDKPEHQESTVSQQQRAIAESSKILKYITGSSKGFSTNFNSGSSKTKRIPRQYYINKNQSILIILQGDITKTKVDAIVNAANEHMTGGSGVDGIIHDAAGHQLYDACKAHKQIYGGVRLPTGHSRILLSYNMSSTTYYIINTAGPIYRRNASEECAKLLSSCYKTALDLANLYDLESIGFTAISCGIFGYPADDGADVALRTVAENADRLPVVVFVLWDNHIYDAWLKKAEELQFTPFDPDSPIIPNSPKPSVDNNQEKLIPNPNVNDDDDRKSSTEVTSPTDETETTSENKTKKSIVRVPSAQDEPSDTQQTELMDDNDTSRDSNYPLTTNATADMANVDLDKKDSTSNNNSQEQPAPEGTNKLEDDKLKSDTNQDNQHDSTAENNPENPDRKKTK